MTQDTNLLTKPKEEFNTLVAEAFKLYRDGDLFALSTSPLAHTSLVENCFLTGEPATSDTRGRILQSLLQWAVDRLRPGSEQDWLASSWRTYNILHYFYIDGQRAAQLAESMGMADQTLYQLRPQAIAAAAHIVHEELADSQDLKTRQSYALAQRYQRHSANQQQLLRIAAIFPGFVPTSLLYQLAEGLDIQINGESLSASVQHLVTAHLLIGGESGTDVVIHPEMRAYLLTQLVPAARIKLHQAAGDHYAHQGDYLEAVHQLRAGHHFEAAAQIIVEHQRDIVDNLQIEELATLLKQFRSTEVSPSFWSRLKIVAGEVAEFNKDIDTALEEYQQALGAPEIAIKARAYYRRAKAFERKNIDESLAHYNYGGQILEQALQEPENTPDPAVLSRLLVRMYIDRAWLFIQVRPDLLQAQADLFRAQALIDPKDRTTWSDLHNLLGEFHSRKGEPKQSEQNYWQAWLAANEVQDAQRMSKTAHNLALVYMYDLARYDQALEYLERSRILCQQTGDRNMAGLCAMSIGACYFWQERFEESVSSYLEGSEIFGEIGNRTLLTRTYCGLAEAYAELNDLPAMRRYYQGGILIARELDDQGALQEFAALAEIELGLLIRVGSGRSTRYVLQS